jgi:hypothetical protein
MKSKSIIQPLLFASLLTSAFADSEHAHHDHASHSSSDSGDFLAPFEHIHFSDAGTPIIHSFGVEPAFTGRDLFLDYRFRSGNEATENEIEIELEWAFTNRLGVIFETSYKFEKADGEEWINGIGDIAVVPRALLIKSDRFMLTAQVEVVAPTGTDGIGGETAVAPGLAAWTDLGGWWTLNTQVAVEHIFEEDVSEFVFGFGLVKSFDLASADGSHGHKTSVGILNLHLEATGAVALNGEEEGDLNMEGLLGVSYGLSESMDCRLGYEFPITTPREFDGGVVAGVIWHF